MLHVVKGGQARLSMAALACYPSRAGPGATPVPAQARLIWRTKPGWYHDGELTGLLDQAHQQLAAPMILIWDNLPGHHSGRMHAAIHARDWLEVHNLPSYAPELNPVEGLWAHLDATVLANLAALTLYELRHAARAGLRAAQRQACLLHGFLAHAGLQIQPRT